MIRKIRYATYENVDPAISTNHTGHSSPKTMTQNIPNAIRPLTVHSS
jgi:hypothetical protein